MGKVFNNVCITKNIPYIRVLKHRGVEQLVARRAHNPKVAGSSPVPTTIKKPHHKVRLFYCVSNKILLRSREGSYFSHHDK